VPLSQSAQLAPLAQLQRFRFLRAKARWHERCRVCDASGAGVASARKGSLATSPHAPTDTHAATPQRASQSRERCRLNAHSAARCSCQTQTETDTKLERHGSCLHEATSLTPLRGGCGASTRSRTHAWHRHQQQKIRTDRMLEPGLLLVHIHPTSSSTPPSSSRLRLAPRRLCSLSLCAPRATSLRPAPLVSLFAPVLSWLPLEAAYVAQHDVDSRA
jgi:hypothetical protein